MNDRSSGINAFGDSKKSILLSHRIYLSLILCTLHRLSPPFPFNTHHPDILLWWHPKSVTPLVHIFKTPVNFPYQHRIKWHFVNTFGIDYGLLIDIASSYFIQSNHWKKNNQYSTTFSNVMNAKTRRSPIKSSGFKSRSAICIHQWTLIYSLKSKIMSSFGVQWLSWIKWREKTLYRIIAHSMKCFSNSSLFYSLFLSNKISDCVFFHFRIAN